MPPDAAAQEIERLRELLRRALPDLKWAETAADQEWSACLSDVDIIRDIEAELARQPLASSSGCG